MKVKVNDFPPNFLLLLFQMNTRVFMQLKEMGYSPTLAKAALRRSNNDMNVAIQLLASNDFVSEARANIQITPSTVAAAANAPRPSASEPSTSAASAEAAAAAEAAVAALTATANAATANPQNAELIQTLADQLFETMMQNDVTSLNAGELEKSQKAYESLKKDTCTESEYIDLTLSDEMQYLDQYKILLTTLT